ncbi:MAG: hypothetical protein FWC55_04915 [Firmicutes bacterium]|nr:hypothetical protein [Bacillota bacterium]
MSIIKRFLWVSLPLLIIADVLLYFWKDVFGFWMEVVFAGMLWFTVVMALKYIRDYIERRDIRQRIKSFLKLAADIIEIAAFICAFLYCYQDVALFHPNGDFDSRRYILSQPEFTEITVEDGSKTYTGYIRRGNDDNLKPLIVLFLGNAQNAAQAMASFEAMNVWGSFLDYNVLIMDYPGYGDSDGWPSAAGLCKESLLTYDYIAGLPNVDTNRIIVGGYSVGTGPAAYLAANRNVAGLFLLAPYASGYDLYNSVLPIFHGPLQLLVKYKFPSCEYAASISAPALIVASKSDEIVPFASSERLTTCFQDAPVFIALSGISHNGIFTNRTTLANIQSFLSSIQ